MARKRYSDEDALKILLIWSLWLTQTDLRPKNAALISHARKIFQTEKLPTGAITCVYSKLIVFLQLYRSSKGSI